MTVEIDIRPVRRRKLYEDIVESLERLMLDGALVVGDQLPSERELMQRFQVGRTSVREALFALSRRGLVTVQNGERAMVTRPTPSLLLDELTGAVRHMLQDDSGVRHLQAARILFEVALAREATRTARAADLVRLKAALERNGAAIADADAFIETDVAFHYVLAEIPRNPIFTALHAAMANWLREQRAVSVRETRSAGEAFAAHQKIYDAVAGRDPEAAEQAMRDHLEAVGHFYWQARDAGR